MAVKAEPASSPYFRGTFAPVTYAVEHVGVWLVKYQQCVEVDCVQAASDACRAKQASVEIGIVCKRGTCKLCGALCGLPVLAACRLSVLAACRMFVEVVSYNRYRCCMYVRLEG